MSRPQEGGGVGAARWTEKRHRGGAVDQLGDVFIFFFFLILFPTPLSLIGLNCDLIKCPIKVQRAMCPTANQSTGTQSAGKTNKKINACYVK